MGDINLDSRCYPKFTAESHMKLEVDYNILLAQNQKRIILSRSNISNTRDSVLSGFPNTEKRVENTTRSGVFLTKFEVFG